MLTAGMPITKAKITINEIVKNVCQSESSLSNKFIKNEIIKFITNSLNIIQFRGFHLVGN